MKKKARQKPVKSPLLNPSEPVKQNPPENQITGGHLISDDKEKNLEQIIKDLEGQDKAVVSVSDQTPAATPEDDLKSLELYKKISPFVCNGIYICLDRFVLQPAFKLSLKPMTEEQMNSIKDDAAMVMKNRLDKWLPSFMKDNPEETCLIVAVAGIVTANIQPIEKKKLEPVNKPMEAAQTSVEPAPEIKQSHTIEVTQ